MKITILGCGTAALNLKKHEAGYLLEHKGKRYLFDSGVGTVYRLLELGIKITEINNIFYSHLHNDHINDLPAILWSDTYEKAPKKTKLRLYGPKGFKNYFKTLTREILRKEDYPFHIEVNEVTNKHFSVDGLKIKTKEVRHKGGIAYRVEAAGKVFVFSGDVGYGPEIVEISKGADVLILECAVAKKEEGHLTPAECGIIANKAKVKRLILTHMYPVFDNVDAIGIVKKQFKGRVELAKDFMEVKL
jgi:ribonuclease BN (tRNA processing enzyme)